MKFFLSWSVYGLFRVIFLKYAYIFYFYGSIRKIHFFFIRIQVINIEKIKENIVINNCVEIHEYHDIKVSNELGFFCNKCKDGVIGFHPINDGENNF